MWSLKITTEQRYKYFEPILPDIRINIDLLMECFKKHKSETRLLISPTGSKMQILDTMTWLLTYFKSCMIERTLDNNYQITFYE